MQKIVEHVNWFTHFSNRQMRKCLTHSLAVPLQADANQSGTNL